MTTYSRGVLCRSSPPITADRQPIVAYLKLGRMLHRILTVSIATRPFFPVPNIKEKKVVWLARLAHTWYVVYDGSCYLMPFCTACECTCHCLFCQHKHVVMMISIAKIHYRTVTLLRGYYRDIHKSS